MEILDKTEFVQRRGRMTNELYDKINELPSGSVVQCEKDVDFKGTAEAFRGAIIYSMKRRGRDISTSVQGDSVLIRLKN